VIQAVTFDFWGTLYSEIEGIYQRRRLLRYEYSQDFFQAQGREVTFTQLEFAFDILSRQIEHLRLERQVGINAEELGLHLGRTIGVELEADKARELGELISITGRECPPAPMDGAKALLEALRGRVKTAVISDTGMTLGPDLYSVMERDRVAQLLQQFTFSDQTGTTKPQSRQFLYTLHKLGVAPEAAVHVGDLEDADVIGAKGVGMRAIRIVRPGSNSHSLADAVVSSVCGVLPVLEQWGLPKSMPGSSRKSP
jgi:putative hydrolase of the HAD superfamily